MWTRLNLSPLSTHCHPSRSLPHPTWLAREDLHGGYKARKYLSLIPQLLRQGVSAVRLRGSSHSNNLLQLSLRLKQVGIRPIYLLEGREGPRQGNGLFSRMVLGEDFWEACSPQRLAWLESLPQIPEGAEHSASLPGVLTLAASLAETGLHPSSIYIDAGTGMSACGLLLGMAHLGMNTPVKVVWLGDRRGDLQAVLQRWRPAAEELLGPPLGPLPPWEVVRPPTARSFGTVNQSVLREVARIANQEGILVDPIYTAKLFLTARATAEAGALLYVGGGGFELAGFQEQLARL